MKCHNDESIGRQIYITGQILRNFAERALHPFDVTPEQFHVLKCIVMNEVTMTQKRIGEMVSKTPANTTRILDRLAAKHLIRRTSDPTDRRAMLVELTEAGEALVDKVSGVFESFSDHLVDGVSIEEQKIVRQAFNRISENIVNMEKQLKG